MFNLKIKATKMRFPLQSTFIFGLLCSLVYFTSYMTRINYGAAISEIAESLNLANNLVSMAVTGSFITYGFGQPICGVLGDRFGPRGMIFVGLIATSLCNFSVSFMNDIYLITVVWCFNGFFQAMMWPPLVRIMIQHLTREEYRKVSISVASASSVGTIVVYLLVPLCIVISSWRLAFAVPAILGLVVAFTWFYGIKQITARLPFKPVAREETTEVNGQVNMKMLIVSFGLLPILFVIILQGALRDGITTWMPTYINDTFQWGTSYSILVTAILPIVTIISVAATTAVQKVIQNEIKTATYIWALSLLITIGLLIVSVNNAFLSVLFMALLSGCMHGINLLLISHLPMYFARFGKVSTVSGMLNAFTYVGSAISAYGIAVISDLVGWGYTIVSWGGLMLLGFFVCLMTIKRWARIVEEERLATYSQ